MSQIACQRKDKTLDIKHPSKRNRHTGAVLLHRELYFNLNRHGRALTNIGFWSRVHKTPTGVRQKTECPETPQSFEKRIGIEIRVLKHVVFRISATF